MKATPALFAILLGARLAAPLPASDAGRDRGVERTSYLDPVTGVRDTGRTHETVALIDLRELPAQDWTR